MAIFKHKYWFISFVIILNFLLSSAVFLPMIFANDALVGESAHTPYPLNTDKIGMLSEYIKIVINQDTKIPYLRWASVSCEFLLENATTDGIKAKIGFTSREYSETEGPYLEPPLKDFKAYINDIQQKVEIKKEILKQWESEVFTQGKWEKSQFEIYRYWYTWDVLFPPLKKTKIKNTYSTNLSTDRENFWFEYIMTTVSNWKGTIKEVLIEVIYPNEQDLKNRVIEIKPAGYKIDKNRIYWEFKNFKPTEDIKITEKWIEKQKWLKKHDQSSK